MSLFGEIAFGLLVANGLRVVLGIPPIFYWFRSHTCPTCDGKGVCLNDRPTEQPHA